LCDILYACLVTGYGTKPAAGWTREFVNATFDKAVFQNDPSAGTGFYLQVDGYGAANAYTPKVQGYEAMTSVDDGLFPFNASAQTIPLSNAANTTARPWLLIADNLAFYFVCWSQSTSTPGDTSYIASKMFFGDIVPFSANDEFACALSANGPYGSFGPLNSPSATAGVLGTSGIAMPRRADGSSGSILPVLVRGGGPGADMYQGSAGVPYTVGGQILIARPHINNAAANTIRGWLPGLYYPCHQLAFSQFQNVSVDGLNFVSLRHNSNNSASSATIENYFLSLDDWRV
jgi:hypothetical protein